MGEKFGIHRNLRAEILSCVGSGSSSSCHIPVALRRHDKTALNMFRAAVNESGMSPSEL